MIDKKEGGTGPQGPDGESKKKLRVAPSKAGKSRIEA